MSGYGKHFPPYAPLWTSTPSPLPVPDMRDVVIAQLVGALGALQPGDTPCKPACGNHGGYNQCTCGMESKRQGLFDALAAAKAVMP